MRTILQAVRRAPSLEGAGLLSFFCVVLNLELLFLVHFAMQDPVRMRSAGCPLQLVLTALLGGALFVWSGLHITGRVSFGTGAAFRVAGLGLVAVLGGRTVAVTFRFESVGVSVYDAFPAAAGLLWIARNLGLAAYAYGLVSVALSCWAERRLRRTAPAWVAFPS